MCIPQSLERQPMCAMMVRSVGILMNLDVATVEELEPEGAVGSSESSVLRNGVGPGMSTTLASIFQMQKL